MKDTYIIFLIITSVVISHLGDSGIRTILSISVLVIAFGFLFGFIRAAINDLRSHK